MGIFDRLRSAGRIARTAELLPATSSPTRTAYAYTTPFRSGEPQLVRTVVADVLTGQQAAELTRERALQLPAVANGRAQIIARIASRPLRDYGRDGLTKAQPAWLYRTSGDLGPWQRMARTLDDLIFYGESLWLTERGERSSEDARRPVTDAIHWPRELWQLHPDDRRIQLRSSYTSDDWIDADREQVLYIPGPFDGLLRSARKTIEGGLALEAAWVNAVETPVPAIILREKEENPIDPGDADDPDAPDEVGAVIRQVAEARRDPNGRVMFVPWWIDAEVVGEQAADLLIEARNAVKLDIAAHLGLTHAAVDAALPKASLNYETQASNAAELHDRLDYWTAPIEEALSGDLMTERGRRVRFDFADARTATGPTMED